MSSLFTFLLSIAFVSAIASTFQHSSFTSLFPRDTVLAANLTEPYTYIELSNRTPLINPVLIFPENCEALNASSKPILQRDFEVNDVERASIIDQNDTSHRNYFVPPTTGHITVRVNTASQTNVSICLFKRASDYDSFMLSKEEKELQQVMHNGLCDLLPNVTQAVHNMSFTVNVSSYYFAGVRIPPNSPTVDSLHISISLERYYYDTPQGDEDPCSLHGERSQCKLKRRDHKTCILLYTEQNFNSNDFIEIHIYTHIFWDLKINPLMWIAVVVALVTLALLIITILVWKYRKPKPPPTEADH